MMPLWMMATLPSRDVCGCALVSFGTPFVAQRVWPMPTVASGIGSRSMSCTRLARRPASYGRPHAPCQAPSAPRRPNHIRGIPIAEVLGDTPPKACRTRSEHFLHILRFHT